MGSSVKSITEVEGFFGGIAGIKDKSVTPDLEERGTF